jgi:hypothetical protein
VFYFIRHLEIVLMHEIIASTTDRRGFLRLGLLSGVVVLAGCGDEGKETAVTAPPVEGGGRKNLEKMVRKGAEPPAKKGAAPAVKKDEEPATKKEE